MRARARYEEDGKLCSEGHLLGMDSERTYHKLLEEYYENVRIVDEGVRKVEAVSPKSL